MLTKRDKDAIFALLIRQVKAQESGAVAQKDLDDATKRLAVSKQATANIRTALGIFGFDMTIKEPWDQVRDAIGASNFNSAIRIGKGEEDEEDAESKLDEDEAVDDTGEELSDNEEQETPVPPNIKDFVLTRLQQAGGEGVKVASIKEFIAGKGIEMHEKTVGMTLYRLSKDRLARRDGRMWFFVPQEEETNASNIQPNDESVADPSNTFAPP
jgi:hypothetical protein